MSMLPYYFEDARDEKGTKKDNRYLFEGLKINGEGGTGRSDLFIKTVTRRKTAFVRSACLNRYDKKPFRRCRSGFYTFYPTGILLLSMVLDHYIAVQIKKSDDRFLLYMDKEI